MRQGNRIRGDPQDIHTHTAHTPHKTGFATNVTLAVQPWSRHITTHHMTGGTYTFYPRWRLLHFKPTLARRRSSVLTGRLEVMNSATLAVLIKLSGVGAHARASVQARVWVGVWVWAPAWRALPRVDLRCGTGIDAPLRLSAVVKSNYS